MTIPPDTALVPTSGSSLLVPDQNALWPVSELELVLKACNPGKPLLNGDSRYVDFTSLRRGIGIKPLQRHLTLALDAGEYHHCLLCGHRGSGKSTELLTLQQWANDEGFLAVWMEVNERFGMTQLDYSDLFLLAAVVTEQKMAEFGHPLPKEKLQRVIEWFRDIFQEDTEEKKSEIGVEVGA